MKATIPTVIPKQKISFAGLLCAGMADSGSSLPWAKLASATLRFKMLYSTQSTVCKTAKVKFITVKTKSCTKEEQLKCSVKITIEPKPTLTGLKVCIHHRQNTD